MYAFSDHGGLTLSFGCNNESRLCLATAAQKKIKVRYFDDVTGDVDGLHRYSHSVCFFHL